MTNELFHHGVSGQKWGLRRHQRYSEGDRQGIVLGRKSAPDTNQKPGGVYERKSRSAKSSKHGKSFVSKHSSGKAWHDPPVSVIESAVAFIGGFI